MRIYHAYLNLWDVNLVITTAHYSCLACTVCDIVDHYNKHNLVRHSGILDFRVLLVCMVVGWMEEQRLLLSGACQSEDWVGGEIAGFCVVRLSFHSGCWGVRFHVGVQSVVVVFGLRV